MRQVAPLLINAYLREYLSPRKEVEVKARAETFPPHILIEPPEEAKTVYQKGEEIVFYLILFGYTAQYIPYFLYAFELLGQVGLGKGKHQFDIINARAVRGSEEIEIYDGIFKVLTNQALPIHFERFTTSQATSIRVNFVTPTHIKSEGKILHRVSEVTFYSFLKAVFNRLSTLSYFYGKEKFRWDYKAMLEKAKEVEIVEEKSYLRWQTTRCYSQRKKREDFLTGVTGKVTYSGPHLGDYVPYLKFGEYAHVGNRTTFGLGKYKIFENPP